MGFIILMDDMFAALSSSFPSWAHSPGSTGSLSSSTNSPYGSIICAWGIYIGKVQGSLQFNNPQKQASHSGSEICESHLTIDINPQVAAQA